MTSWCHGHGGCSSVRPMARKQRTKRRRSARRVARSTQAASVSTAAPDASPPAPAEPSSRAPERSHAPERRRALGWPIGVALVAVIGIGVLLAMTLNRADEEPVAASASPGIVVGVPGGEVLPETATATASPVATPSPSPSPTIRPTVAPTASASPPPVTPAPTAAPTPAPPPPTPEPTIVVVALAQPDDAVASFYADAAAGDFDAAYALWSDRMKATYPRHENLDDRFDQTASITFEQLAVASQTSSTASVQANFVETYDSGSSREFVGYWELVLVDGRWLLDAPHY